MGREIELKLAVPDDALTVVAGWLDQHGEAQGEATMLNVYLDTPARDLARARAALRLRRKGIGDSGQWLQTLKTVGRSVGGMTARNEWETPVAGEAIELHRFPDDARKVLAPLMAQLAPAFRTDFVRRTWIVVQDGERIEAALDTGTISAAGVATVDPIQELELEWLSGDEANAETALRALGERLGAVAPLTPSDLSKAARGYRLTTPD